MRLLRYLYYLILWLGLTLVLFVTVLFVRLPSVDELRDVRYQQPLRILTSEGELISQIGTIKRTPIHYADVPEPLINALLAAEDSRFFQHLGLDPRGLARAILQLVTRSDTQTGASTITMQVARNYYLTRERTILRKLNEILMALKMERVLTKEEIFSLYINKIFLGFKSYGMAAAAQTYYNKDLAELTIAQYAMLAALPKAPSAGNPVSNPKRAKERRDWILSRMASLGYISRGQYLSALEEPLTAAPYDYTTAVEANYLAETARLALLENPHFYGIADEEEIYTAGYSVITTVRKDLQQYANAAVRAGLLAYDRRHGWRGSEHRFAQLTDTQAFQPDNPAYTAALKELAKISSYDGSLEPAIVREVKEQSIVVVLADRTQLTLDWDALKWAAPYISVSEVGPPPKTANEIVAVGDLIRITPSGKRFVLAQSPTAEGALIAVDPRDGRITAMVGGYHYQRTKFNRAVQARRQLGSAIKPFIYAHAFDTGYTGADIYRDAPLVGRSQNNLVWRPSNVGAQFLGYIPLRQGLYRSRNLVSVRLLGDLGIRTTRTFLTNFGLPKKHLANDLALALGSAEVTPYEVVRAYSVFANGGYLITPYVIESVVSHDGTVLYQAAPEQVLSLAADQRALDTEGCKICAKKELIAVLSKSEREALGCGKCQVARQARPAARILNYTTHYQIHSVLKDVIQHGTARRALVLERTDLAGKTGTTQEYVDAWFAGYHPHLAAVSWVGFDKPSSLGPNEYGGVASLPIWIDFMRQALKGVPQRDFTKPEELVPFQVDDPVSETANANFEEYVPANHLNDFLQRASENAGLVNYHYTFPEGEAAEAAARFINTTQKEETDRALKELF